MNVTALSPFKSIKYLIKTKLTRKLLKMTEKKWFKIYFDFLSLVHVPSTNMEKPGFMACTGSSHQGEIETL